MKTADNFNSRKRTDKRHMTIATEHTDKKNKNSIQTFRQRLKTTISGENDNNQQSFGPLFSAKKPSQEGNRLLVKTQEDEESVLTNDFMAQWSRITAVKRETYSKLRNQFVKKFPGFLGKYKEEELDGQLRSLKTQHSQDKKFIRSTYSSVDNRNSESRASQQVNPNTANTFYSRSKKKCFTTFYEKPQSTRLRDDKTAPFPRLSFISYMHKPENRNQLKRGHLRGTNMITKKQEILSLEKEGSKQYAQLKRYLEDAIDTCKKK